MTDIHTTIQSLYKGPDLPTYLQDENFGDYELPASSARGHEQHTAEALRSLRILAAFVASSSSAPGVLEQLGGHEGVGQAIISCVTLIEDDTPSAPTSALPAPWSNPDVSAAASHLLERLSQCSAVMTGGPSGRFPELFPPRSASELERLYGSERTFHLQQLLVRYSRVCLSLLRPAIESGRAPDYDQDLPLDGGYSAADRLLAGQRLCRLLQCLRGPALSLVLNETQALVFCADCWGDASPRVQLRGARALHWAALEGTANDLRPFRDALPPILARGLSGGEGVVWSAKMGAATAVIVALEGQDPRSEGYGLLIKAFLAEAEVRATEDPLKRASLLAVLPPLAEVLGLTLCRHLTRLLPLLCEWLFNWHETQIQALTLDAWVSVVRVVWPRLGADVPHLLNHLLSAYSATRLRAPPLAPSSYGILATQLRARGVPDGEDAARMLLDQAVMFARAQAEGQRREDSGGMPDGLERRFTLVAGLLWQLGDGSDGLWSVADDSGR